MPPAVRSSPRRILVTAGPTRERIDPVRFISNYSTGTLGYAIAAAAKKRGHRVTLISGPTALAAPRGVKFIAVESALQMREALLGEFPKVDALIMAAAVCDWRPARPAARKIKRRRPGMGRSIKLAENPDILLEAGRRKGSKVLVGFALETEDLAKRALLKLKEKNLDYIVCNKVSKGNKPFGAARRDALIISRDGTTIRLAACPTARLANAIIDKVEGL